MDFGGNGMTKLSGDVATSTANDGVDVRQGRDQNLMTSAGAPVASDVHLSTGDVAERDETDPNDRRHDQDCGDLAEEREPQPVEEYDQEDCDGRNDENGNHEREG